MATRPTVTTNRALQEAIQRDDVNHLIHPYTAIQRRPDEALIFKHGSGITLVDIDGEPWLDAAAGQLNVNIGYGRPELAEVAAEAMRELSYASLFFGCGSSQAAQLAAKLASITQAGIDRFFFTVGGSDATDTSIKLLRYYHAINGLPNKVHIIGRMQSYHGMSLGAWSLTGDQELWNNFGPRVPGFSHIQQPSDSSGAEALEKEIIRVGPENVAAFFAEPISMPARVNIPPDDYWPAVREICDRYDVLLVADEVVTGFGRTGRMFAMEHWGVVPDLVQMSKGLTGGYAALGAVGISDRVADGLRIGGEFFHGFTWAGQPSSCALALANIGILEEERLVERAEMQGKYFLARLEELVERTETFTQARGLGLLLALDVSPAVTPANRAALYRRLRELRLLIRPYDDGLTIGFAPSLAVTEAEIDEIVSRVEQAASSIQSADIPAVITSD